LCCSILPVDVVAVVGDPQDTVVDWVIGNVGQPPLGRGHQSLYLDLPLISLVIRQVMEQLISGQNQKLTGNFKGKKKKQQPKQQQHDTDAL